MNILVGLDFSAATPDLLRVAAQQAKAQLAQLWLIHVAEAEPDFIGYRAGPTSVREQVAHEFRNEHQELQQHADALRQTGLQVTALLERGQVAETLLQAAEQIKADLVIVGSHGRGALLHLLLGSVSTQLLKRVTCPVLIVPVHESA